MLPLDPAQEAPERDGGIEETSHSPWIAIALVFYNTGEIHNASAGEGATASNQGQQIIMGKVDLMLWGRHNGKWEATKAKSKTFSS